ncbi:MAG: carbamoyl-phosphate synthase large subunit [Phycisphaerae bacterium]
MPRRDDIHTILIIGSGPIVIGQGCEFDYSGTQACQALKAEGYRVVLVNSNPATIMTDPGMADATYVEPILPETIEKIIEREKAQGMPIDAVLPTLGGQTALNTAMNCFDQGIFTKHGVRMIGADRDAIFKGEDRQVFKELMLKIGLDVPLSETVHNMDEGLAVAKNLGLPLILRPAFTLGGTGGGIAYNIEEFREILERGLDASPVSEVLVEQSVLGWKEFELEVVRDHKDNCIVICSIENIDAMGVHTGDSVTVAPIQTLTDKEYQRMRDAAFAVIRAVGVETGGSNIQFAVDPATGRQVVVEMNPRVSRSSALASKATGYPIAKIAAKLAVGYTLDELPNDITGNTVASFEPTIDYVVIKFPRWTFEKFPDADETLTTQMKSVGEAMAIGRTFKEALQKGIRSLEVKRFGFGLDRYDKWLGSRERGFEGSRDQGSSEADGVSAAGRRPAGAGEHAASPLAEEKTAHGESLDGEWPIPEAKLRRKLAVPSQGRLYYVRYAFKMGWTVEQVHDLTHIDPWFLAQMKELEDFEGTPEEAARHWAYRNEKPDVFRDVIRAAKQRGYSDVQLAHIWQTTPDDVRAARKAAGVEPVYKLVDTCAAEFEASTPYYYSTYEQPFEVLGGDPPSETETSPPSVPSCLRASVPSSEDEIRVTDKPKVIIIGGGPNRIGQGIEFDYCCVQAAYAMKALGYESVMINSNPETVSTDYDTSDLLFFEPLTHEDVLNICERLNGGPFQRHEGKDAGPERSDGPGLVKGVIVQFGGQTPLNLAKALEAAGVPILGTPVDAIDRAGDRERFRDLLKELGLKQPANGIARNAEEAKKIATEIGYPVLVRPSFVLGGRAMEIVSDEEQLDHYMKYAVEAADRQAILVDRFLDGATEVDVDCVADFKGIEGSRDQGIKGRGRAVVCGVMEHIEEAGIHSGDSACSLPPYSLSAEVVEELKRQTRLLAEALGVCGLMNVQYAVRKRGIAGSRDQGIKGKDSSGTSLYPSMPPSLDPSSHDIFVIEVNPRASRTVPFVGKATGVGWANIAAQVMAGKTLDELNVHEIADTKHVAVKESVFPFSKFPGVDIILGPEMRSTGEVMGIDATFPLAYLKSQLAEGMRVPTGGTAFVSVRAEDKDAIVPIARDLHRIGFKLISSSGTAKALNDAGVPAETIFKLAEGRPNLRDFIANKQVQLIVNTATRKGPKTDEGRIRALALTHRVPIVTTLTGASATVRAIEALKPGDWSVKPLQAWHAQ